MHILNDFVPLRTQKEMKVKAMHLTPAIAFLLAIYSVSGVQGQNGWSVTYSPTQICAIEGSTVHLHCNYTHPDKIGDTVVEVRSLTWFTKGENTAPVDLNTDLDYAGRVEYKNACTVAIRDVRETDSAVYKIRLITNHQDGKYTGLPGSNLTVSALKLQVIKSKNSTQTEMRCKSNCLPDQHSYIWIKNREDILANNSSSFLYTFSDTDHISCAATGNEKFPSPSVYAPRLPAVSVSSPRDVVEGSLVTLTCKSDANPSAFYTWYKDQRPDPLGKGSQLIFKSVQSSDSGTYFCTAGNVLKMMRSKGVLIDVEYVPTLPYVSFAPSGGITEGSSLTMNCSSDANPKANYTWFKENEETPQCSTQNFTIRNIGQQHSGLYYCEAHNRRGSHKTSIHFVVVARVPYKIMNISKLAAIALLLILLFVLSLCLRKKKATVPKTEFNEYKEDLEFDL